MASFQLSQVAQALDRIMGNKTNVQSDVDFVIEAVLNDEKTRTFAQDWCDALRVEEATNISHANPSITSIRKKIWSEDERARVGYRSRKVEVPQVVGFFATLWRKQIRVVMSLLPQNSYVFQDVTNSFAKVDALIDPRTGSVGIQSTVIPSVSAAYDWVPTYKKSCQSLRKSLFLATATRQIQAIKDWTKSRKTALSTEFGKVSAPIQRMKAAFCAADPGKDLATSEDVPPLVGKKRKHEGDEEVKTAKRQATLKQMWEKPGLSITKSKDSDAN